MRVQLSDLPICACGCGRPVGHSKGRIAKFAESGCARRKPIVYLEEDRGYATPCWIWQGLERAGYGRLTRDGRDQSAHRYMYEQANGLLTNGLFLDHLCRTPACVNPAHLEPVTNVENLRRGATAILTWTTVTAMRLIATSTTIGAGDMAEMFGVSRATVNDVKAWRTWQPEKSWPDAWALENGVP